MKEAVQSLREKVSKRLLWKSELPLIVYIVVFISLATLWLIRSVHEDLTLNLFSELLGAAFTLFIIDTLLVRSKTKRWNIVREHVDYLIGRHVQRLRDGLATRVFGFKPTLRTDATATENITAVREQRAVLLRELAGLPPSELESRILREEAFAESTYQYLNEKADDIWDLLNMKYSEYLEPELVALLIELHTLLKDAGAHIRQYRKKDRFQEHQTHYSSIGTSGFTAELGAILLIVNRLKDEGYSDQARGFDAPVEG
ncbi:MAG: hypothetical protein JJU11_02115 [Candidatus Sumerlaeia bacterium]|nr:hypothetical protein [Candidatus Sumerlaeia bacterium]